MIAVDILGKIGNELLAILKNNFKLYYTNLLKVYPISKLIT